MGGGNTDDDGGDGGCQNGMNGATTFGFGANGGTQIMAVAEIHGEAAPRVMQVQ